MCSLGRDRPKTRHFGARTLDAQRCAPDFSKVDTEVPQNLAAKAGVELHIRIEIEAHAREGFDDSRIRTVSENATTPKFQPEQLRARLIQRRRTADGGVR
jgi:hypothetical protein